MDDSLLEDGLKGRTDTLEAMKGCALVESAMGSFKEILFYGCVTFLRLPPLQYSWKI